MDSQPKILPPNAPSEEVPPEKEQSRKTENTHGSGFNIIETIYSFLITKEPIAFSYLEKYKGRLQLRIEHPYIYTVFLVISLLIDSLHALFNVVAIGIILIVIVLSFAKGVGIFDWFPKMINDAVSKNAQVTSSMDKVSSNKLFYLVPYEK